MSIFDDLKKAAGGAAKDAVKAAVSAAKEEKQTFTFEVVRCDRRKQEKPVPEIDSRAGCFIG